MRLTKGQEVWATNELIAMLAKDKREGGLGLHTSEMQAIPAFHPWKKLSLRQIAHLLRKSGKATLTPWGSRMCLSNEWRLTDDTRKQARN